MKREAPHVEFKRRPHHEGWKINFKFLYKGLIISTTFYNFIILILEDSMAITRNTWHRKVIIDKFDHDVQQPSP